MEGLTRRQQARRGGEWRKGREGMASAAKHLGGRRRRGRISEKEKCLEEMRKKAMKKKLVLKGDKEKVSEDELEEMDSVRTF